MLSYDYTSSRFDAKGKNMQIDNERYAVKNYLKMLANKTAKPTSAVLRQIVRMQRRTLSAGTSSLNSITRRMKTTGDCVQTQNAPNQVTVRVTAVCIVGVLQTARNGSG